MPQGLYVDVKIATADDGPGALGGGDDGKVLAWDDGTQRFVMATGGGGSFSEADPHTWTRLQTFATNVADGEPSENMLLLDDISQWTEGDSTDWSLVAGVLSHTPGAFGEIGQDITFVTGTPYTLTVTIAGMSAGGVDVYTSFNSLGNSATADGVYNSSDTPSIGSDILYVDASSDFDGTISLSVTGVGAAPSLVTEDVNGDPQLKVIGTAPNLVLRLGDGVTSLQITDNDTLPLLDMILDPAGTNTGQALTINAATIVKPYLLTDPTSLPPNAEWLNNGFVVIGADVGPPAILDADNTFSGANTFESDVAFSGLPTSDPGSDGAWLDGGRVTVGTPVGVQLGTANEWTAPQTYTPGPDDAEVGSEILLNSDIADWTEGDPTNWSLSAGALSHTPGAGEILGQNVTLTVANLYRLTATVTGMTTGTVFAYSTVAALSLTITVDGAYSIIRPAVVENEVISAEADSAFDGQIAISLEPVTELSMIKFNDVAGADVGGIGGTYGALAIKADHLELPVAPTAYDATYPTQLWDNAGFISRGDAGAPVSAATANTFLHAQTFVANSGDIDPSAIVIKDDSDTLLANIGNTTGTLTLTAILGLIIDSPTVNLPDLPTAYDGSHPDAVWLNSGFLFQGDPTAAIPDDPTGLPSGTIYTLAGALMVVA